MFKNIVVAIEKFIADRPPTEPTESIPSFFCATSAVCRQQRRCRLQMSMTITRNGMHIFIFGASQYRINAHIFFPPFFKQFEFRPCVTMWHARFSLHVAAIAQWIWRQTAANITFLLLSCFCQWCSQLHFEMLACACVSLSVKSSCVCVCVSVFV